MTATLCLIAAKFNTTLNLKTAIGATTATLDSATDDSGVALPTGRYGLTIDGGTAAEEFITCTLTGTALTSIKTVTMQGSETSGTTKEHRKGATVKITDFVVIKKMLDNLNGTTNFNSSVTLGYDGTATISSANQFATKAYVDATATGTTNFDQVVVAGNAGATVSAGQLLYLDVADGEWKLCDADTAATVDNIILGIAQGAGTDGVAITGGILTYGLDSNQTGLTNNTVCYAGNTAGAIVSTTPGTTEVTVGIARSTTSILFDPRYNQEITEDIQDALVGNNTDIVVGTGNKFVTQTGLQKGAEVYAATATGNDTYVITLSPAPTSLVNGMRLRFKADVANTGAATLNVNSLGAISLVTGLSTALATGDIVANQVVEVVYNSTGPVFQVLNPASALLISPTVTFNNGTTTKDSADASATQNIAHGLSKAPKQVKITAIPTISDTSERNRFASTVYNGTTQSSLSNFGINTNCRTVTTFSLNSGAVATDGNQTGVVTFDATNIIITWTKTSNPTGIYTLIWEAITQ